MGSQLGYGFLVNPGVAGLLGGQVFGTLVGAAILIARGLGDSAALFARSMKRKTILAVARKYHEFPKHTISTSFLNTLSVSILPFMLSSTFGTYIAGLTMFAQRLLMAPLQILTQSLWQVAHAQLPAMEWDAQADLLRKLHKYAAFLFAFPLIAIAVLSGFTGTVFGGKWHNLSLVLPCVALMVLISSVSNCTSYFTALGRYRAETVVNVTLMAVRLTSLVLGVRYLGQYAAVNVYAISSVAVYLGINCYWGLRFGLLWTFARNFALSISISVIVLWPVKLLFPKSLPLALSWTAVAGVLYYYLCAPIVKNKPVVPAKDNAE